ncbi:serine protease, partial [bacterium]|nr:serine protease [bacterium]
GYFVFSALLESKLTAANQAYIDAVDQYKRVYYLPEDYSTAALTVTSKRLDSVLEITCSDTVGGSAISGSASGIVITSNGYAITNHHVVTYEVTVPVYNRWGFITGYQTQKGIYANIKGNFIESSSFYKSGGYSLQVIEVYEGQDLALLKFVNPPASLEPAPIGNSSLLVMGEETVIIGNAQGYGLALTTGVVSNPSRLFLEDGATEAVRVLQTDAALNPGNSGGPVFNIYGEVVGVVSFKIQEDEVNEGLGFAVLSNVVIEFLDNVASDKGLTIAYILSERGEVLD